MRKVIYKFWTIDKHKQEEAWLNQMATEGKTLVSVTGFRYVFEDTTPKEYQYRILLLDECPWTKKSKEYLSFLEETGIENVGRWMRWVYLRKKNNGQEFEIFSDINSELAHLKKIERLVTVILTLEIALLVMAIVSVIGSGFTFTFPFFCNLILTILVYNMRTSIKIAVTNLERESALHE